MSKIYDCIVLGVGGVGSAACYYAAKRGWRTLGLDRFPPGHARGSSHGRTRIIRRAYFEHPDYVPLLLDAYQLWDEFERDSDEHLFQKTGLLQVGHPDGPIIGGIRQSADQHDLSIREYDTEQLREAFPLFNCRDGDVGLFEENAGFLRVESAVTTFAREAQKQGAELIDGVSVSGWSTDQAGFTVQSGHGSFRSQRLIVTAGSWTSQIMPRLADSLKVMAKHQHWFHIPDERTHLDKGCPTFFFETDDGYFYGFPAIEGCGTKISEHSGGASVVDPLAVDRELDPLDLQRVQQFAHQYFNTPRGIHRDHSVCMYTMSPDEHFIVDTIGEHLSFACGLSGHGFKFAPVLGKSLVDMVDGVFRADMDFLKANRFNDSIV